MRGKSSTTLVVLFAGLVFSACDDGTTPRMSAVETSAEAVEAAGEPRSRAACDPMVEQSCANSENGKGRGRDKHHGVGDHRKACVSHSSGEAFVCRKPMRGQYVGLGYECGGDKALLCAGGLECSAGSAGSAGSALQAEAKGTCIVPRGVK